MMQDESRNTQIGVITFHDNLRPRPKTKGPANNKSKRGPVNNRKVIGRKRTDKKVKKGGENEICVFRDSSYIIPVFALMRTGESAQQNKICDNAFALLSNVVN